MVYGPAGPVGVAPGKVQLVRGAEPVLLTFKATGYRAATREVVPSADGTLAVTLTRSPPPSPSRTAPHTAPRPHHHRGRHTDSHRPADPNSIENPFGGG